MSDPKVNSLLIRLEHATALEANDTLGALLKFPDAANKALPIVEHKIDDGTHFGYDLLAELIVATHSERLYNKVRESLLKSHWTALKLYEDQYPDQEIERNLSRTLYEIASDDGNPLRSSIVDAMSSVASEAVLPTLEAILFDLEPSAKIRTIFADSLSPIEALEAVSRAKFVKRVARAIENIKSHVSYAAETMPGDPTPETEVDESNNATRFKTRARQYIDTDPQTAIIYIRLATESLAKDLYRRLGHEQQGKPARKMMLEDLLKFIRDSSVPEVFKLFVTTLQLFGNFASHDQDEQSRFLTRSTAEALLALYEEALLMYSDWSKNFV